MVCKKTLITGLVLICTPMQANAFEKLSKADKAAIAMTVEQSAAKVTKSDDPLDTAIMLSTEEFKRNKVDFFLGVGADKYLRAIIDKKTGTTVFQVYWWSQYVARDWAYLNGLNYESPNGPVAAEVSRIKSDVSCSNIKYVGCTYLEVITAEIPENILRNAAIGAAAGTDAQWKVRVSSKAMDSLTSGFLTTEIAGLLVAVDNERSKLGQ